MPGIIILIFIVYFVFIFGVIHLIARRARARRKNEEAELPEWRRKPLTKEQQASVREQYTAYRAEVYKDYPEADRFEKNRRACAGFIVFFYLVTAIFRRYAQVVSGYYGEVNMVSVIIGTFAGCLFGAAMIFVSVERRQLKVLLYIIGLVQLVSYIRSFSEAGINSFEMFLQVYIAGFRYYPMTIISDFLSFVYTVLLLLIAVWMTVFKRNRELAEQVDILNEKIKNDFKPTGI